MRQRFQRSGQRANNTAQDYLDLGKYDDALHYFSRIGTLPLS